METHKILNLMVAKLHRILPTLEVRECKFEEKNAVSTNKNIMTTN